MKSYLAKHPLVWILPMILVPLVLAGLAYLAYSEATTPDSPFIYEL